MFYRMSSSCLWNSIGWENFLAQERKETVRIGSVVKLSRPYEGNISYLDEIGVVVSTRISRMEEEQLVCTVRFVDPCNRAIHQTLEIYAHRLDVLKE